MSNKKAQNATGNSYEFRIIPIESINESESIRETNEISSLVASIRAHGLINPITVSIDEEKAKTYKVVAGHGRFAALKILEWKDIPCNVITNAASLDEISLSENVTRMDMTPYEECVAVHALISRKNTPSNVAKRFGRILRWVLVREKLAKAGEKILEKVKNGKITIANAQKIADLPDKNFKDELECCYNLDDYTVKSILERYHMDLKKAPFDTTACETCSKCSACQQDLFDEENEKLCLDLKCWKNKIKELAQQKADKLCEDGVVAVVEYFVYGNDCYDHAIKYYEKKELAKAKDTGINERAVVSPETAEVTKYYDKRDLPDYHEETEEERDAREKEREDLLKRTRARDRILVPRLQEQILEKVKYFGSDGLLAIMLFAGTYDVPTKKVLKANGFEESECDGDIDISKIPDDFTVSKIVKMIKDSTESIVNSFKNIEHLKKLWNVFVRDENIPGKESVDALESTEEEIIAEIERFDNQQNEEDEE